MQHKHRKSRTNTSTNTRTSVASLQYKSPTQKIEKRAPIEQDDDDVVLLDLLCVALHFAGLKQSHQEQILQAYADELDNFDDDTPYGQEEIIALINTLKSKFPESFVDSACANTKETSFSKETAHTSSLNTRYNAHKE